MKLRVILIVLVLAVALAGVAAYQMMKWAEAPVVTQAEHPPSKVVVIAEGSTFQHVAGLLERERLIKSRSAFVLIGKASAEENDGWIPVRAGRGAADTELRSQTRSAMARVQWSDGVHAMSMRLGGYGEERGAGLVGADSAVSGSNFSVVLARPNGAFGWRVQACAARSDLANSSVPTAPARGSTTPANDQHATPATGWGANAAMRWSGEARGTELRAPMPALPTAKRASSSASRPGNTRAPAFRAARR